MEDNIPNNLFIDGVIEKQIQDVVAYRNSLIEKHTDVFENEKAYIRIIAAAYPKLINGRMRITFETEYIGDIPQFIKDEFDNYLEKVSSGK